MPEGPEVKVITRELNKILKENHVLEIIVQGGRYKQKDIEKYQEFINLPLEDKKIISVNCKGKFIWFQFPNQWSLWCTLGMSGGWRTSDCKHCDVKLVTDQQPVWFQDQRHFGTLKFCDSTSQLQKKLASLGPDLLSDDTITLEQFTSKIQKYKNQTLPKVLMNQSIFSGIGNYLKSEILYATKISPFRKIQDITNLEFKELFDNINKIIQDSYKAGGASIRNYSDLYQNNGKYTFSFQVYNKKEDVNGNTVKKEMTSDDRTTHWVPQIQK